MKSKIVNVVVAVLLVAVVLYGIVVTVAIRETMIESSELKTKYDEVVKDYKEVSEQYSKEVIDKAFSIPIVLEATAQSIDKKGKVSIINDETVYMRLPYVDNIKDRVEEYVWAIIRELKQKDYKSCVITVIDDHGKCVYGWSILQNGDTYTFISE